MHILIVGNIIRDVYLDLDSRTENFELDKNNTKWLDLSFNASKHHFFNRESSLGGAAITLEVLEKMGLKASVSDSGLTFSNRNSNLNLPFNTHRYILISDNQVTYFTPTEHKLTNFSPPAEAVDYLFVDRSAKLDINTAKKIITYLELAKSTKLILYVRNFDNQNLNRLVPYANLIFLESNQDNSRKMAALELNVKPEKLVHISADHLSYLNIVEQVSVERIDMLTHLSVYSIAAATIFGGFILGQSVEKSLKMTRINLENSKLNATLSLDELQKISKNIIPKENLELIAANLMLHPKGILAADESGGSIKKKFAQLNISDTYENRRDYRNILFTTPDLEKYVNGVILFDETTKQVADNGQNFVDFLINRHIIPGVKVDQGLAPLDEIVTESTSLEETYTKGLNGLSNRLKEYYLMGLRFAKWRAAFKIRLSENNEIIAPTKVAVEENCRILAEYAKTCQLAGLVPIVEPEVIYDDYYSIAQNFEVTSKILDCLFEKLAEFKVNLRAVILKTNMILAGKKFETQSTPEIVGQKTALVLKEHVPEDLAGIVFLSGGQTADQATKNLAAIKKNGPFPWPITFSFARALQDPALYTWRGDNNNSDLARKAFRSRLIANTDALKQNTP